MHTHRHIISLTTLADGSCVAYSPEISGLVSQIRYVKTDFADGVDFTVTAEATGVTIWIEGDVNASTTRAPRQPIHDVNGVVCEYSAGFPVTEKIALSQERIKIMVAGGGDIKLGTIHFIME